MEQTDMEDQQRRGRTERVCGAVFAEGIASPAGKGASSGSLRLGAPDLHLGDGQVGGAGHPDLDEASR